MICYIVLHYMVLEETVKCIESIKNISGKKKIIIVDNNSINHTGIELRKKFLNDEEIVVIINKENLGFAKANNIGYHYAIQNFEPKFIVIMNNDVEIVNKNFDQLLENAYLENDFTLLGPKIFSTTLNTDQNPKKNTPITYEYVKKINAKAYYRLTHPFYTRLRVFLKRMSSLRKLKYKREGKKIDSNSQQANVVLHGSFLVFSPIFFSNFKNAFFEDTFFYFETEILDYLLRSKGLKSVYYPEIRVLHHQHVSTKSIFKSEIKRINFMNQNIYNSTKTFMNYLENEFEEPLS